MKHYVYILYSVALDKYYVGETEDLEWRLAQHNSEFFKNAYTSRAHDWTIYFALQYNSRSQARKIEEHIKKMKNRKYYESVKKYPEMSAKLLNRFS